MCVSFCLIKRARWCAFGVCMCRVPNSFLCTSCILLEPLHRPVTPVTCVCVCVCGCTCAVRVLRGVCVLFIHTNANKHTQDVSEEIPENTYVIPEGFSLWDAPPPSIGEDIVGKCIYMKWENVGWEIGRVTKHFPGKGWGKKGLNCDILLLSDNNTWGHKLSLESYGGGDDQPVGSWVLLSRD